MGVLRGATVLPATLDARLRGHEEKGENGGDSLRVGERLAGARADAR